MKVSEIGEFALVEFIKDTIERGQTKSLSSHELLVGIGDDTAVWHTGEGLTLATTDTLVEDVHFKPGLGTWEDLGWKSLAVSLSDIAAMGGLPRYALVSLSMPSDTKVEDIGALYRGVVEIASRHDVALVGGNTTRASEFSITTTIMGVTTEEMVLRRSSAKPGHLIAVTGFLGMSACGFQVLTQQLSLDNKAATILRTAFLRPQPRLAEGRALIRHGVKTAIDISDGLFSDLTRICQASGVSARVEVDRLPIHPVLQQAFPKEALSFALSGGEDYELLFTADAESIDQARGEIPGPVSIIGQINEGPGEVTFLDNEGKVFSLARKGWEHFKD